jgi:hypothetical protein
MVTTRRQEQQRHTDAQTPTRVTLRDGRTIHIKSALKRSNNGATTPGGDGDTSNYNSIDTPTTLLNVTGTNRQTRQNSTTPATTPGTGNGLNTTGVKKRVRYNSEELESVREFVSYSNHNLSDSDDDNVVDVDVDDDDDGGSSSSSSSSSSNDNSSNSRHTLMIGVFSLLAWMASSTILIFVNKTLMVDRGFKYPCALTAIDQIGCMILGVLARSLGLMNFGDDASTMPTYKEAKRTTIMSARTALKWNRKEEHMHSLLSSASIYFALSLFLGNFAYLGLSVAYINVLKALNPAVTLLFGVMQGTERSVSPQLVLSMSLIAWGTVLTTVGENAAGRFHWGAFTAFAASIVAEAVRVACTQRVLQFRQTIPSSTINNNNKRNKRGTTNIISRKVSVPLITPMEALLAMGPLTTVLLGIGSLVMELPAGLDTVGMSVLKTYPQEFFWSAVASFLVNLTCYYALEATSGTTLKVAGCFRNVVVVWMAMSVGGGGDVLSEQQVKGIVLSMVGYVLFTVSKVGMANGGGGGHRKRC